MAQTSINIRTDEALKKQFDAVCSELGLNLSTAVNIFMKTVVRQNRIPFPLAIGYSVKKPRSLEEISEDELNASLEKGLADYAAGKVRKSEDVFRDLERKYGI